MLIEIRNVGFLNKGAELMLYSILEKLNSKYPDAKYVLQASIVSAPYEKRISLGLYQKVGLYRAGIQFGSLFNLVPKVIRTLLGVVTDKEIDIVIDAAGFAYSDQWGLRGPKELSSSCKRWKRNGTKVILLPQAFGPFESKEMKKYMLSAVENIDLIFAREKVSLDYLVNITGKASKIKMAPDFTNLIEGIVPDTFDSDKNRFCIVPNYRMIDMTNDKDSSKYIEFMIEVTQYLYQKGKRPFILVHEGHNDLSLAKQIQAAVSSDVCIVEEVDALKIKGIIGSCTGTVGSRFHGLVSALSQGVPTLATGWSHKYQMLFDDYGFSEGLLDVNITREELHARLDEITDLDQKKVIEQRLKEQGLLLKKRSESMWEDVFKVIDSK